MDCPSSELLAQHAARQVAPDAMARITAHAAGCAACRAALDALRTRQGPGLTVGRVIGGRFRIDQLLGAGGMGVVVEATHLELGTRVALKFLRDELTGSASLVERFIREARAVASLRTEHVCRVLDVGRTETGAPYIVMELLEGVDLARTIAAQPLHATIAVEYVMQACVALAEAHAAGIVHRDLKPANLFVTRRPDGGPLVKVLDFGIAKAFVDGDASLTRTRMTLGSPGYMSPEQIESPRSVDARSDVWALGVTLYQLLSRRLPFGGMSPPEMAIAIAGDPPAPLDVDPRLRAVVLRCLEKPRERRYPDVAALAADLAPFGGPAARQITATIAQQSIRSSAVALPSARLDAATAASVAERRADVGPARMPDAAQADAGRMPDGSRAVDAGPRTRRTRWWLAVVPVIGLAALAAGWLALRGASTPASIPAPEMASHAGDAGARDATVAVATPGAGDATAGAPGAPGARDASTVVAASTPGDAPAGAPGASDPWAAAPAPGDASTAVTPAATDAALQTSGGDAGDAQEAVAPDAGAGKHTAHPPTRRTHRPDHELLPDLAGAMAQLKQGCVQMLAPEMVDLVPLTMRVMCACQLRDQAKATALFARLSIAKDREAMRSACKMSGVALP